MKLDSLPVQFKPFEVIEIGTNILTKCKALFEINQFIPILIGCGKVPKVWLSIPADKSGNNYQPIVRNNLSLNKQIVVAIGVDNVRIRSPEGEVLNVKKVDETKAEVVSIDLRPFRINIYTDQNILMVANNELKHNKFFNADVMVGLKIEKSS